MLEVFNVHCVSGKTTICFILGQQNSYNFFVLLGKDGSFQLLVSSYDVEKWQDAEVQGQVEGGKESV